MLKSVEIRNFRCLRGVNVPVRPLTVLVGPNDSGKSSFLDAIRYLVGTYTLNKFDAWRGKPTDSLSVSGKTDSEKIRRGTVGHVPDDGVMQQFRTVSSFQLPSGGVAMTSPGYPDTGAPPTIMPDGQNIPALMDHLLRRDRVRFEKLRNALRKLIDGFEEIEVGTPDAKTRSIDLIIEQGFRIPASNTSVGLRLMLFFVSLAYHPDPPRLILLEEPENGVHPKRLGDVMKLLRDITQGKHGDHAAQVILTTHSPHLLDYVKVEEDQVLVFQRNEDGSRSAEPADVARLKTFLDEFMLGEVWFNEDEAGLIGPKS